MWRTFLDFGFLDLVIEGLLQLSFVAVGESFIVVLDSSVHDLWGGEVDVTWEIFCTCLQSCRRNGSSTSNNDGRGIPLKVTLTLNL